VPVTMSALIHVCNKPGGSTDRKIGPQHHDHSVRKISYSTKANNDNSQLQSRMIINMTVKMIIPL
jgi:hypothetical protein